MTHHVRSSLFEKLQAWGRGKANHFFPSHVQGQRKHRMLQGKLKLWMATWREMAPDFLVVRHFDNLLVPLLVTLMLLVSAI